MIRKEQQEIMYIYTFPQLLRGFFLHNYAFGG